MYHGYQPNNTRLAAAPKKLEDRKHSRVGEAIETLGFGGPDRVGRVTGSRHFSSTPDMRQNSICRYCDANA